MEIIMAGRTPRITQDPGCRIPQVFRRRGLRTPADHGTRTEKGNDAASIPGEKERTIGNGGTAGQRY